jgi:hypothetical protein
VDSLSIIKVNCPIAIFVDTDSWICFINQSYFWKLGNFDYKYPVIILVDIQQNWNIVVPSNLKWNDDSSQLTSEILSTLDD